MVDTSGVTGINIRIELDVGPAVEAMKAAQEVFMDACMVLLYHDDLCDPQEEVFV